MLSVGATGRYDVINDGFTNLKERVAYIEVTLSIIKRNLDAHVTKVENEVSTEINRQNQLIKNTAEELKNHKTLLNEEQKQRKDLETCLKEEQKQRMAGDIKSFGLIAIIVVLFIAWCVREQSMNYIQSWRECEPNVTTSQNAVMSHGDYKMSIEEKLSMFDTTMTDVQSNFPGEDRRFWSSIIAPIHRIIKENLPSRPAIVLIATMMPNRATAECLTREVASQVDALYGLHDNNDTYITIEAAHLTSLDPDEAKTHMDQDLSDNYQGRHMVAVIHDLGSLPASAATLLHAYCDHESAHFKNAVLLATAYLEPGITLCTEEVEAYLYEVWQELEEDVLKPLISRIANNIAIMETRHDTNYVCQTWLCFFPKLTRTQRQLFSSGC